jgi:hypothetical protein
LKSSHILWLVLSKVVLPLLLGAAAPFYGMVQTVVIAGEAGKAAAVVQPLWVVVPIHTDIRYRANLGA